jgi:hypothetical protein
LYEENSWTNCADVWCRTGSRIQTNICADGWNKYKDKIEIFYFRKQYDTIYGLNHTETRQRYVRVWHTVPDQNALH